MSEDLIAGEISSILARRLFLASFDHPIRPRQHIRRNRQADFLSGLKVDREFDFLLKGTGSDRGKALI
jgi:hypothetical protein